MMAGQEDVPLTDEEREKQYGAVPPERWFRNRPVWQRMAVVAAGPVFNFMLAWAIYWMLFATQGQMGLAPNIGEVAVTSRSSPSYPRLRVCRPPGVPSVIATKQSTASPVPMQTRSS
jgi:membrane-associated protease RseP (regulator of RpoE activity)